MLKQPQVATDHGPLNAQREHWERAFSSKPAMFGEEASYPAHVAADLFRREGKNRILELGGGQGRDSLFFARNGLDVTVLDYSAAGLRELEDKARNLHVAQRITAVCHDVRKPLPFAEASFDAVYSHMLFCMALTTAELLALSGEIRRILKPDGLNLFTVRTKQDAHFGTGIHRGEDMYEVGGFIVHFFDRAKVEQLATGYEMAGIEEFEEGGLPRKLVLVTLRKSPSTQEQKARP
jgi:SAM-dependent methyltransferase